MSLKNKFLSAITVAVGIVAFSTFTSAQDKTATPANPAPDKVEKPNRGEGHERGDRKFGREGFGGRFGRGMKRDGMMRMMHDLNLTDAQKEQIRTIRQSNKPDEATRTEMRTIFESRKAGTELTADQKDRIKAIREQGRAKAESVHQQILSVLTADQRAQLDARKQQMKQRMEEHRKMRQNRTAPTTTPTDKPKIN